jgi:hypothetical protein
MERSQKKQHKGYCKHGKNQDDTKTKSKTRLLRNCLKRKLKEEIENG